MRRARVWRGVAALALLATALQLYGLYRVTGPPSPSWFPGLDKVAHAVGFAVPVGLGVVALGLRAGHRSAGPGRAATVLVAAFAGHAVLSELIQHTWYRNRTGDPLDVLADGVGIALGAGVAHRLLRPTRARAVTR